MAEASCSGPSPFKRLVDHQNRDVSRHQDRLRDNSLATHHGGFRSQQAHYTQSQNDFGAFVDGNAALSADSVGPYHAAGRLAAHAAALDTHHQRPQAQLPHRQMPSSTPSVDHNWAADFVRFSGPGSLSPVQQQPQRAAAQNPQQANHMQPPGMAEAFGFRTGMSAMQPNGGFTPLYGPTNGGFMDANVASAQRPAAEADFDEEMSRWMTANGGGIAENTKAMEDVDAVMDQMARELEINDGALDAQQDRAVSQEPPSQQDVLDKETTSQGQDDVHDRDPDVLFSDIRLSDLGRSEAAHLSATEITAETQQQTQQPTEQQQPDTKARSEVSEAAERLLESVQHENGDKWKQSMFLSLMRDFRDGRKDIVDNEIRDMAVEPGPEHSPN
ncbi:hypothetical protein GMORB2_7727 [Geosmithia morbida]|uniref:Peroxin 20 n=1 Tax=Geosmithia morbida TaxID=1094350 RepID=A0A9P5D545_9HYPO|nr:uncharacterized protein GMORB2_7727 [Geosmithia morbida]KAF4122134.1 hypothetical protein GMORB2_7727 [Geosmithia morbida]